MVKVQQLTKKEIVSAAGRVVVLMGGRSAEREVSIKSGRAVTEALLRSGIDATELLWDGDLLSQVAECSPDRVFIALHGRGGEDGSVQGAFDVMNLPYTGSGVMGSSLCMDKVRSKQVWEAVGVPTPPFSVYVRGGKMEKLPKDLHFPVMVKPSREGSSFGASRVGVESDLIAAIENSARYDDVILIEKWVNAAEYTLGIVAGDPLPIIKLETPREFYDYEAKYVADTTQYICPCGLSDSQIDRCTDLGLFAFESLGASGWGRVDFMFDEQGDPWFIELNTVPGMTDHSLVPMAAKAIGISFDELVIKILGTSFREEP